MMNHRIFWLSVELFVDDAKEQLQLCFNYATSLFNQETIQRAASFYQRVLEQLVEEPSRLIQDISLLSDKEYQKLSKIIKKLPLPKIKKFDPNRLINYIKTDKKNEIGEFCFILLNKIGDAKVVYKISEKIIIRSLENLKWKFQL